MKTVQTIDGEHDTNRTFSEYDAHWQLPDYFDPVNIVHHIDGQIRLSE